MLPFVLREPCTVAAPATLTELFMWADSFLGVLDQLGHLERFLHNFSAGLQIHSNFSGVEFHNFALFMIEAVVNKKQHHTGVKTGKAHMGLSVCCTRCISKWISIGLCGTWCWVVLEVLLDRAGRDVGLCWACCWAVLGVLGLRWAMPCAAHLHTQHSPASHTAPQQHAQHSQATLLAQPSTTPHRAQY
jgi:hypothetical protein